MAATARERLIGAIGSATVLTLFGYVLISGLSVSIPHVREQAMALLNLRAPPPPPPVHQLPPPRPKTAQPAEHKAASPAKAAPAPSASRVPAPPAPVPLIRLPAPVVAGTAGSGGHDAAGSGRGGAGSGTGGGGNGTGGGDAETEPRLIRGKLSFSDLPEAMRSGGVGGTVSVRYDVEADGTVGACTPTATSGNAELDRRTCDLIRKRFRFDPARDAQGRPVASTIEEQHSWDIEREQDRAGGRPGAQ